MQQKLMRCTAVFTALFTITAMALMFYYSSVKVIVIAGERTDANQMSEEAINKVYKDGKQLALEEDAADPYLHISLPDGVTPDDITIDNHYIDHIVEIKVRGADETYYQKKNPHGQCDKIADAVYYTKDDASYLCFGLTDIYEVDYVYETGSLSVRFVPPSELYDSIVVLDAGSAYKNTGRDDSIVMEIVDDVRERLEAEGIKVYDVSTLSEYKAEQKLNVIEKLNGHMYVAVEIANAAWGRSGMEAFYNDIYFIPFVGNVTLADAILQETVICTNGDTNGLFPYESGDAILQESRIPSTRLRLGYAGSADDMEKLYEKEYRQRAAEGIAAGIIRCCKLEKQYGAE